jgi:asparagine synthase (glutamine-hydrolysing)
MLTNGFLITNHDDSIITRCKDIMNYRAWDGRCIVREYDGLTILYYPVDYNSNSNSNNHEQLLLINGLILDPKCINGNYAYVKINSMQKSIIFARDPLGCKPLYYDYSRKGISIASDKRVLTDPKIVEPGIMYTYSLTSNSLRKHELCKLSFNPITSVSIDKVVEDLTALLDSIVYAICRLNGKVAVGLSGIDSMVIASIASRYADVTAVTVCMKDSYDYKHTKINSLNHEMLVINEKDVLDALNSLSTLDIDLTNAMDASIASIVHILARYARSKGLRTLMLGQLADELFAGYARYLRYCNHDVSKMLFNDVINAEKDLLRDDNASCSYTMLALPYAVYSLAQYAVNIPAEFKITQGIRKLVLRKVAEKIGIDKSLAYKEKKALQFSSGVYKVVKRIKDSYNNK